MTCGGRSPSRTERQVGFTGFVGSPAAAMRTLDVVVHASTRPEPFGLVIAEAMAAARAVIASRRSGVAEFVRDGETPSSASRTSRNLTRALRTFVVTGGCGRARRHARVRPEYLTASEWQRPIAVYRDSPG